MINLRKMDAAEFDDYKPFLIEDYAQEIARNFRIPIEEARQRADSQTNSLLSQGIATPNQEVYTVLLEEDQVETPVGYLWAEVNTAKGRCFIFDIYLHEQFRGRGLGWETLKALEAGLSGRGIHSIGLHVFADNAAARGLYEKAGFELVSYNMEKWLGD